MTHTCPSRATRVLTRAAAGGAAVLASLGILAAAAPPAQAVPVRTQDGWSVLLCRFSDVTTTPQPVSFFQRFFGSAGAGQSGLYDYFLDQSYGKVKINATVRGWYTMPYSKATEAPKSRWDKINDCVTTAANNGYTVPAGNRLFPVEGVEGGGWSVGASVSG